MLAISFVCLLDLIPYVHSTIFQLCGTVLLISTRIPCMHWLICILNYTPFVLIIFIKRKFSLYYRCTYVPRPLIKVTTETNNHNSCMTKPILSYNFNICYRIYPKLSGINGLGLPDALIMH